MTAHVFRIESDGNIVGAVFMNAAGPAVPLFIQRGNLNDAGVMFKPVPRWILNVDAMNGLRAADFIMAVVVTMGTTFVNSIRLLEWAIGNRAAARTMPEPVAMAIADAVAASPALQEFDNLAKQALDERQRNEEIVNGIRFGVPYDDL